MNRNLALLLIPITIGSLILGGLVVFALWEVRDIIPLFGLLLLLGALGFVSLALVAVFRHVTRPHVIHVGQHGAYLHTRKELHLLHPLTLHQERFVDAVKPPDNINYIEPPAMPVLAREVHSDDEYDEKPLVEAVSSRQRALLEFVMPELPQKENEVVNEETQTVFEQEAVEVPGELDTAERLFNEGFTSRAKLSEAMKSAGFKCSTHKATLLMKQLKAQGRLTNNGSSI